MKKKAAAFIAALAFVFQGSSAMAMGSWQQAEVLVEPSPFHGVHGLAVTKDGRILAGTNMGSDMWQINSKTGEVQHYISYYQGEADDIAISAKGQMAWSSVLQNNYATERVKGSL